MRTAITTLSITFLLCCNNSIAQYFKAGLAMGISTSQVSGDTYAGFNKIGITGGAFLKRSFSELWDGSFEIIYIQKGSKKVENPDKGEYDSYLLKLNYIEVPILAKYHYKKFTFECGPSVGSLIKNIEESYPNPPSNRKFNNIETSINFGISYPLLSDKLAFDWRYSNSILPIRAHASGAKYWFNRGQYNTALSFILHYQF